MKLSINQCFLVSVCFFTALNGFAQGKVTGAFVTNKEAYQAWKDMQKIMSHQGIQIIAGGSTALVVGVLSLQRFDGLREKYHRAKSSLKAKAVLTGKQLKLAKRERRIRLRLGVTEALRNVAREGDHSRFYNLLNRTFSANADGVEKIANTAVKNPTEFAAMIDPRDRANYVKLMNKESKGLIGKLSRKLIGLRLRLVKNELLTLPGLVTNISKWTAIGGMFTALGTVLYYAFVNKNSYTHDDKEEKAIESKQKEAISSLVNAMESPMTAAAYFKANPRSKSMIPSLKSAVEAVRTMDNKVIGDYLGILAKETQKSRFLKKSTGSYRKIFAPANTSEGSSLRI